MSESTPESTDSIGIWDIVRYIIAAVGIGFIIWWVFYTPPIYGSKEHIGKTMGTDYVVKVAQFPENGDWQEFASQIQDRLDTLEQMMSTFRQDSEVSQFNVFSSTEDWFPVSKETAFVVQTALEVSRLSGGAFDITVAPLVRHWGFGAGASQYQAFSFEEQKSAAVALKERVGYDKLSVRLEPPALKKSIPELTIDLSGIAKGFALDYIAEFLDEHKFADYLIEVGGEVRGKGKRSAERDWIVGIEKPIPDSPLQLQQTLPLRDRSLATSGNYLQVRQIGDRRFSHLIDPRTGLPAEVGSGVNELVSVSVLAPTGASADAWATAMFVLGEQRGVELANQRGIAVLFLLRNGNNIVESPSTHW